MTTTLMLLAGERWPQDPVADWVLLDAARRPLDHGRSDPRHWPAADRHEIVLAGSRVIRLELELPPAPKREQPQLIRYALESHLARDPDLQHLTVSGRDPANARVGVLVVARSELATLVATCKALGRPLDAVRSALQLAPPASGEWTLALLPGATAVLRTGLQAGMALDADSTDTLAEWLALQLDATPAEARPTRLEVRSTTGTPIPETPALAARIGVELREGPTLDWWRLANDAANLLLGSSFAVLRFGHLMHHRYNRNPIDRPDSYDPAKESRLKAKLAFLFNLLGGLYLVELAAPLVCLLPRPLIRRIVDRVYRGDHPALRAIHQSAERLFLDPRRLATIRTDAVLAAGLIVLAIGLYGSHWPMLAAFLLARGVLVSLFDNVYHFATPVDRPDFARNLWLPAPFRLLVLNMNLHRVHHLRPALPWWALPGELRATGDRFDAKLFPTALAQFAGPVPVDRLISSR